MLGSDDVLACFIAGNVFTWDDWFRLETLDDSLQPTIDMLLNVSIFMWYGAVCPWHSFVSNDVIPIYRLIPLGILVLLLRRLPVVLSMHTKIHQIEELKQAIFVGFFGPIGVSAIFYLYVTREFLRQVTVDGVQRADAARLAEQVNVVVWFLAVCSIVVHGLCIPLTKLGFYLPRTISTAISSERVSITPSRDREDSIDPRGHEEAQSGVRRLLGRFLPSHSSKESRVASVGWPMVASGSSARKDISGPTDPRLIGRVLNGAPPGNVTPVPVSAGSTQNLSTEQQSAPMSWQRSIRFQGEEERKGSPNAERMLASERASHQD